MSDVLKALSQTKWLATLDSPGQALLAQNGRVVTYRSGRRVSRPEDPTREVMIVTSGTVRLGAPALERGTSLVALRGPGALLGAVEALSVDAGVNAAVDVVTLEAVTVIAMPTETFLTLTDTERRFAAAVSRELAALSTHALAQAELLAPLPVAFRLRQLLLRYANVCGSDFEGGTTLRPRLTQASLAQDLGVERKSVLRAMDQLRNAGLLDKRNARYFLPSVTALRAWIVTEVAETGTSKSTGAELEDEGLEAEEAESADA